MAHAAVPTLDNVFPAGGQLGSTFAVIASGRFDPWPVKVWIDCPGVKFKPGTNTGQFTVTIAKDAPIGPHFIRTHNGDGASEPRTFMVGRFAEVAEKEPNDNAVQAQAVASLPVVVNGRLEKRGDVDAFAVRVEAGRWLVARADGYALGSPMDPFLHVLDARGVKLASGIDTHNLDPLAAVRIERAGTYIVQVAAWQYPPAADVQLFGSAACNYRLTITDGPLAFGTLPAGAQRGRATGVQLLGWNLDATHSSQSVSAADAPPLADATSITPACADRALVVQLGDFAEQLEAEPNDGVTNAQLVAAPCFVSGRIERPGDEDRFAFHAKKGDRFNFRMQGAALQSQLDPWVRVEDDAGKQLAFADDGTTSMHDPALSWTAPADGRFVVAVGDLFRKGAPDFRYRLAIAPPRPDFRVSAGVNMLAVGRGMTNTLTVTVTQSEGGFTNLVASIAGLPEGVRAAPVDVPPRSRAAAFNLKSGPIPGDLLLNQIDQLWLTVTPGTPPAAPPAKKEKR